MINHQNLIGRSVVVRSNMSGVWFGILEFVGGEEVVLTGARRAWQWQGAGSCSELAVHGPASAGSKICVAVSVALIRDVCEVLATSDAAASAWRMAPEWNP